MLSDSTIQALDELLFCPPWQDSALDYFGFHGAVTANSVSPVRLDIADLFLLVTGLEHLPPEGVPTLFNESATELQTAMCRALDLDQGIELPLSTTDEADQSTGNWCAGFVDVYLQHEEEWLKKDQDSVIELLMPILTLSDAFDDEDFRNARKNSRLCRQMAKAIPESIKDLYLHFHA